MPILFTLKVLFLNPIQELQMTNCGRYKKTLSSHDLWTLPGLSISIIFNGTWLILIQWIGVTLSGDDLI